MLPVFLMVATSVAPAPLAFELQAPAGSPWRVRAREAVRTAADSLQVRTRLVMRSSRRLGVPRPRLSECRRQASLGCWIRAVTDIRADAFSQNEKGPADFLFIRLLPLPNPDRALVLIWLVDLEKARIGLAEQRGSEAEAWLLKYATQRRRLEVTWGDGALDRAFERLWNAQRERFLMRGLWWPNGSVRLQTRWLPPFSVTVDNGPVRTATAATVVLPRLAEGQHQVRIETSEVQVERTVTVPMGRQAVLHVNAEVTARSDDDDRPALLWTGVGVAAVGAAIVVAGLVVPVKSELVQICAADETCDEPQRFARSSDYFSARETADGGSGPLVVPLGYSLMATGGAWSLTALLSDEPRVPWWAIVLGTVVGGAAYGISEAVQR